MSLIEYEPWIKGLSRVRSAIRGGPPVDVRALRAATGICVRDDVLYVCDTQHRRLVSLHLHTLEFNVLLTDLNCPYAVTLDAKGDIYMADESAHCVLKLTRDGTLSVVAGLRHSYARDFKHDLTLLKRPYDLVYDEKRDLLVIADQGAHRVVSWAPGASAMSAILIEAHHPRSIALNEACDTLWLGHDVDHRVVQYAYEGTRVQQLRVFTHSHHGNDFAPAPIALSPDGQTLYIVYDGAGELYALSTRRDEGVDANGDEVQPDMVLVKSGFHPSISGIAVTESTVYLNDVSYGQVMALPIV